MILKKHPPLAQGRVHSTLVKLCEVIMEGNGMHRPLAEDERAELENATSKEWNQA